MNFRQEDHRVRVWRADIVGMVIEIITIVTDTRWGTGRGNNGHVYTHIPNMVVMRTKSNMIHITTGTIRVSLMEGEGAMTTTTMTRIIMILIDVTIETRKRIMTIDKVITITVNAVVDMVTIKADQLIEKMI